VHLGEFFSDLIKFLLPIKKKNSCNKFSHFIPHLNIFSSRPHLPSSIILSKFSHFIPHLNIFSSRPHLPSLIILSINTTCFSPFDPNHLILGFLYLIYLLFHLLIQICSITQLLSGYTLAWYHLVIFTYAINFLRKDEIHMTNVCFTFEHN
jgi:hypothetical protein